MKELSINADDARELSNANKKPPNIDKRVFHKIYRDAKRGNYCTAINYINKATEDELIKLGFKVDFLDGVTTGPKYYVYWYANQTKP